MAGFEGNFANTPRRVIAARKRVVEAAGEWFAASQLLDIEVAVGEVLAGAALRGYRNGSLVNVWAERCGRMFVIEISDAVGVLMPRDLDAIETEDAAAFGCSVRLMHELMDDVE